MLQISAFIHILDRKYHKLHDLLSFFSQINFFLCTNLYYKVKIINKINLLQTLQFFIQMTRKVSYLFIFKDLQLFIQMIGRMQHLSIFNFTKQLQSDEVKCLHKALIRAKIKMILVHFRNQMIKQKMDKTMKKQIKIQRKLNDLY